MKRALISITTLLVFSGIAAAGSTIINPSYQEYSSATAGVFNAGPYKTKSAAVNGIDGAVLQNYSGTVTINCGPTKTGPFTQCATGTAITANGITTWTDAFSWLQVVYTKGKHNVKVWLLGNQY